MTRAILVPRCNAVMRGRKQLFPAQDVSVTRFPQFTSPGIITVCPRLLMGNNSVTPCIRARTRICIKLGCGGWLGCVASIDKSNRCMSYSLVIVSTFVYLAGTRHCSSQARCVHPFCQGNRSNLFGVGLPPPVNY